MAEKHYYEKFKLSDDFYKLILFIGLAVIIIPMLYYFGDLLLYINLAQGDIFLFYIIRIGQFGAPIILAPFIIGSFLKLINSRYICYDQSKRRLKLNSRWRTLKSFDVSLLEKIIISPNYSGLFYKFTAYNPSILRNTRNEAQNHKFPPLEYDVILKRTEDNSDQKLITDNFNNLRDLGYWLSRKLQADLEYHFPGNIIFPISYSERSRLASTHNFLSSDSYYKNNENNPNSIIEIKTSELAGKLLLLMYFIFGIFISAMIILLYLNTALPYVKFAISAIVLVSGIVLGYSLKAFGRSYISCQENTLSFKFDFPILFTFTLKEFNIDSIIDIVPAENFKSTSLEFAWKDGIVDFHFGVLILTTDDLFYIPSIPDRSQAIDLAEKIKSLIN